MNETPRTDAEAKEGWSGDAACVSVEFAMSLERKLNALITAGELILNYHESYGKGAEALRKAIEEAKKSGGT